MGDEHQKKTAPTPEGQKGAPGAPGQEPRTWRDLLRQKLRAMSYEMGAEEVSVRDDEDGGDETEAVPAGPRRKPPVPSRANRRPRGDLGGTARRKPPQVPSREGRGKPPTPGGLGVKPPPLPSREGRGKPPTPGGLGVKPRPQNDVAGPVNPPPATEGAVAQENVQAAQRLDRGAVALGNIRGRVEEAGASFPEKQKTHQQKQEQAREHNRKRNLFQKLFGTGKQQVPPDLPALDHAAASSALGRTQGAYRDLASGVRASAKPAAEDVLPAAADAAEKTATVIEKQVETPYVEQVRDVATGMRSGDKAAIERALSRGGDIERGAVQFEKMLGKGGQGEVVKTNYLEAFPMAFKQVSSTESRPQNPFEDEFKEMKGADSPNVLKPFGKMAVPLVGSTKIGFAMEIASKGSLKDLQALLQQCPLAERIEIVQHLMRGSFKGLVVVHGRDKVHGDIKEENILIGDDYEPKLMDFGGVQNALKGPDERRSTRFGTTSHSAPEVNDLRMDQASDIWSMGETILQLLFGKGAVEFADLPKQAATDFNKSKLAAVDWMKKVEDVVKKGLPKERAEEGERLLKFLRQLMAFDPAKRMTARQAVQDEFLSQKAAAEGRKKLRQIKA